MDQEKGFFPNLTRRAFFSKAAFMTALTWGGLASVSREICWGQSGSSNKAK